MGRPPDLSKAKGPEVRESAIRLSLGDAGAYLTEMSRWPVEEGSTRGACLRGSVLPIPTAVATLPKHTCVTSSTTHPTPQTSPEVAVCSWDSNGGQEICLFWPFVLGLTSARMMGYARLTCHHLCEAHQTRKFKGFGSSCQNVDWFS